MFRRNIYKWHRTSSLIIAIPVLLWALSGFLHPIMTNLRPKVAGQGLVEEAVDSSRIKVDLQDALQQNKIDSVYSVRLVHIDTSWFYQVKSTAQGRLEYFSTLNGKRLKRGDWLYAQYLAKLFLEGQPKKKTEVAATEAVEPVAQDCCDAATDCVMLSEGAAVTDVSVVSDFDGEYKSINRILPVYKVSFERPDGVRLYVETAQSRFALAVDNRRAAFTTFFSLVHTWGWLSFLGKGRLVVEILLLVLAFATTIMGLYIFFSTKSKKIKGSPLVKARRNHRFTAVIASLFTLMFTFSGAWHAFSKFKDEATGTPVIQHGVPATALHFNFHTLQAIAQKPVSNIGLIEMDGKIYWQLYTLSADKKRNTSKDLMKAMGAAAVPVVYVQAGNHTVLPEGDDVYARSLAGQFSGYSNKDLVAATLVTKFTDEYNFTDKRLPVWKLTYTGNNKERFYVETTTGSLAKRITDKDLYEGTSFALLHKHHFMDFGGKVWRDASTMFWAAMQVLMVVMGLVFYFKWRKKKRSAA
jgi:hypothetical protein